MQTNTTFTLFDGSKHETLEKAKNHCDEAMGAALKNFAFERGNYQYVYQMLLDIVAKKKHDKAIFDYVAYRKEHDALCAYALEND